MVFTAGPVKAQAGSFVCRFGLGVCFITLPWDIKPGTSVIRHKLLSLQLANGGIAIIAPGPQGRIFGTY
jgi:hypothetical protein